MQLQHFGEHFEKLRKVIIEIIQPNKNDEQATADEEDGAVAFCQTARDVYAVVVGSSCGTKNPDFLVRFKECLDIGVAEVSFSASAQKDIGDLCHTVMWSKRVLDEIITTFENIEQVKLIFFQAVGQTCIFCIMKRADTVYISMEFARLKIAYTVSNGLTDFKNDARDWLLVCRTFDILVITLNSAKERKSENLRLLCL